ncbi:unnamed protein product [Bursaphelenchus okinawaensis]|uniref:Transcription initiation factor IIF subunit alpha n=1 Tax=Bursaphelenchus okinawaensis TaxID=465554 RepID=A0A811K1Z0_9BILA|nr:unnamed protein product [Bursaphelenchus okinawaensis]CAG9090381.1 unnamed protein product [Bursaphelenchus okinawaensis]
MDKEMVAVGDETGMRDSSEDEDEEEKDEEKEEAKKQLMKKLKEQDENKEDDNTVRMVDQVDERDSSGSDSDDPDNPGGKTSVLFMQKKRKRTAEDTEKPNGSEKKPKLDIKEEKPAVSEKKPPTPPPPPPAPSISGPPVDKLDEETVRRLLLRKPHTTKELLNKIRPHCGDMSKTDIVARLADILRKIEPHQFRQQVNRKDVLFFSLKPPQ